MSIFLSGYFDALTFIFIFISTGTSYGGFGTRERNIYKMLKAVVVRVGSDEGVGICPLFGEFLLF